MNAHLTNLRITIATIAVLTCFSTLAPAQEPTLGEDPAIVAILAEKPSTPRELVRAADLFLQFKRPELALQMLARLGAARPNDKAWAALVREFGSAVFARFTREPKLAPLGLKIGRAALDAATRVARDPKAMAEAISRLRDPSERVRNEAMTDLRASGAAATVPLVKALADPAQARFHPIYRETLVALGKAATRPLAGVLESDNARLRLHAIRVLAKTKDRDATMYLFGSLVSPTESREMREAAAHAIREITGGVVTRREAEHYLRSQLNEYLTGKARLSATYGDKVELWHWDHKKQQPISRVYSHANALAVIAARLGRDLNLLTPSDPSARRLYLTGLLKAAAVTAGRGQPLAKGPGTPYSEAVRFGANMLESTMAEAMKTGQPAAASAAAEILGDIGSAELLIRTGPRVSPLLMAVRHSDRRLRFAALSAIIKFNPRGPYPGSSFVPEALGFFAGSFGDRRVLIGHPNVERARALAGALAELGFDADITTNGRDFFRKAVSTPDYEMLLVAYVIDHPTIDPLLQELSRDRRTSQLPVGVMTTEGNHDRASKLARAERLVTAFPYPLTAAGAKYHAGRLLKLTEKDRVTAAQRGRQAKQALQWLAILADSSDSRRAVYNLHRQEKAVVTALFTPALTLHAAPVLGKLGTPGAQRALVDQASQSLNSIESRKAAATAFNESVRRHGILLTKNQLTRQYDRYNASEKLDKETQEVLAAMLDSIESRTKTAAKK